MRKINADVQHVLAQPGMLPPGITYELGGLYQQQQIAFVGLAKVFLAALVAELVLLLLLYERFRLAIIIEGTYARYLAGKATEANGRRRLPHTS